MGSTGDNISASSASWTFSGPVATTFDDHVSKSVPGYSLGHQLICIYSDFFVSLPSKRIYDIGSSTGQLISILDNRHRDHNLEFVGIEPVQEMINQSQTNHCFRDNVSFLSGEIQDLTLEKSSIIISYYTLQFISPAYRQYIIQKIYDSLEWGGAFFFFEKVRGSDARFQDLTTQAYHEFKLEQGYSPEQIFNKSRSLKGVLEPYSVSANQDFLSRAGFHDFECIFKMYSFHGWLAIK